MQVKDTIFIEGGYFRPLVFAHQVLEALRAAEPHIAKVAMLEIERHAPSIMERESNAVNRDQAGGGGNSHGDTAGT